MCDDALCAAWGFVPHVAVKAFAVANNRLYEADNFRLKIFRSEVLRKFKNLDPKIIK